MLHDMLNDVGDWYNIGEIPATPYVCGYCGNQVASARGMTTRSSTGGQSHVAVCPVCKRPTFLSNAGEQVPGPRYGADITNLPEDVHSTYGDIRTCMAAGAYSGAWLLARKLLMHIAVDKGEKPNLPFNVYITYICAQYFPAKAELWMNQIRKLGNDEAHELQVVTQEQGRVIVDFVEMVLRLVYDFPARIFADGDSRVR